MLNTSESQVRGPLRDKLEDAQDAAILYFLTQDVRYARFAGDILQNVIEGYTGLVAPGSSANTGWLLATDHLKEVREVATESPIIYDFIYDWLKAGNKVWDVKSAALVDFNFNDAQTVFRTDVRLAKVVGHTGSNWSVVESPSLVRTALALDDPAERAASLRYYLDTDTSKQDSLRTVAKSYAAAGDIWPESFQYSGDVNEWSNYLMVLLERYDPANRLYAAYPNIAWSLKRTSELIFPNGDAIRFGDGHRDISEPYFYYEIVYAQAVARGYADLQAHYGALINAGVAARKCNRASVANYASLSPRQAPLQLLWFAESEAESANVFTLPRTDTLPFAGVALQRNLSSTGSARNSLMAWVGGAAHVHSHATGMNLELFGAGEILGADGGLTTYGDTITENYYRVFAAHNTVIVHGASRGQGDWADLGMETVQTVAMEPQSFDPAVSPDFSFTCSSFNDTRGTRAEATQQRTVALVRTSPTTGFYVDLFRSDSRLSPEFHDYIYHNVGDALILRDSADAAIPLSADATRFQNDIGDPRKQPGWRYFGNPRSSGTFAGFVHARFTANNLPAGPTRMDVFIPGAAAREYTTVTSPPIKETSTTYDNRRAPTLVIRRTGEAWAQPFIAVYEPTYGTAAATIRSVEKIESAGLVVGVKVVSLVGPKTCTHYVLSLPTASTYTDAALNLSFTGRFAIVADNSDGSGALYLGSGSSLSYRSLKIASRSGVTTAAELRSAPGQAPVLTANSLVDLTAEGAPVIATPPATQAVAPGSAVSFSVAASGTAPLSYQWKHGGAPIAGATSSTYALPSAQAASMGFYSVSVSNPSS